MQGKGINSANEQEISVNTIGKRIYAIRGYQVMLDFDLSEIYQVETRILKRAVRSNAARFADDFMFELTKDEFENLRCQIGASSLKNNFEDFKETNLRSKFGISSFEDKANNGARPILRSNFQISSVENSSEELSKPNLRSKFVTSNEKNDSDGYLRPCLRSQIVTSSLENNLRAHGGSRYTPFAFTELGVAMLSSVLNSERAIQINAEIMRVFVQLRSQPLTTQGDWVPRVEALEKRLDQMAGRYQDREVSKPRLGENDRVSAIQNAVARRWGVSIEDLKSPLRAKSVSLPRQIAIYFVRKHLSMSFPEIGRYFGSRDHTSILHAYRKIEAFSDEHNKIRMELADLQAEIQRLIAN